MTYDPIASTTLASSASSVTFSSLDTIAAGYRDLVLVVNSTTTYSGGSIEIKFNASSSNYNYVLMSGSGSAAESFAQSSQGSLGQTVFWSPQEANVPTQVILQVLDFAQTDKHKSALMRISSPSRGVLASANRWADTSAITSISYATTNMIAGSTFSLFGIVA